MKRIMVGFFNVAGEPDSVETEVVGSPKREYAALRRLIELKHPNVASAKIKRIGSHVELRDASHTAPIPIGKGRTIGQIFTDAKSNTAHVGRAFFESRPVDVFLVQFPASGKVSIHLHPLLKSDGNVIQLPNNFTANRLASELPEIVCSSLGASARSINLRFV